jgi:hypothetical protein
MIRMRGLSSFEFYFVIATIGIIVLVGIQRYLQLAEQTRQLGFEVVVRHFNTSVYNLHVRWMLAQDRARNTNLVLVQGMWIHFSDSGWPIAAYSAQSGKPVDPQNLSSAVSLQTCKSLWFALLQNPAALSYQTGDAYGTRPYHLSLTPDRQCRFEFISSEPGAYYFDYSSVSGQVRMQVPSAKRPD